MEQDTIRRILAEEGAGPLAAYLSEMKREELRALAVRLTAGSGCKPAGTKQQLIDAIIDWAESSE